MVKRPNARSTIGVAAVAGISLALSACAGMSPTEQRVLSGGAGGAAGGAAIGAVTGGSPTTGAILGGAAGAAGGYIYDQSQR
jgi:osmotically inducible lipoprotein OsmB